MSSLWLFSGSLKKRSERLVERKCDKETFLLIVVGIVVLKCHDSNILNNLEQIHFLNNKRRDYHNYEVLSAFPLVLPSLLAQAKEPGTPKLNGLMM